MSSDTKVIENHVGFKMNTDIIRSVLPVYKKCWTAGRGVG